MEDLKAFDTSSDYDEKSMTQPDPDATSFLNYSRRKDSRFYSVLYPCYAFFSTCWKKTFGKIDGDWVFLTLLGVSLACISSIMEFGIKFCTYSRLYLYQDLMPHAILQYIGWIWIPVCLILFSTTFTKLIAPQAAGSGIPEMLTIFKGAYLKELLSFKAFIAKVIGLTAALGTGLPFGKEGPFVHISCMAAILLAKVTSNIKDIYRNKSRHTEVLSAACAVGVATALATPVGGVLFSIEVTAVHFAVRNYWRGFYAAVCCTLMNRLLAVWLKGEATFQALFKTSFVLEAHYAPQEIFAFAFTGLVCGFIGAAVVWVHRQYMTFKNNNSFMQYICNKSFLLYPFLVTLLYTSLTFPLGLGMFISGELTTHQQVMDFFGNFSWQTPDPTVHQYNVASHWINYYTGIFPNLIMYILFNFFGTIVCITLPVPHGVFIPHFKLGAAVGRLIGEIMYALFPDGISLGTIDPFIIPGAYSIVGAAALAGAVTHTVSTSVIAFEITGQISYAIPIMVGVFISNAVAQCLQPSIFESIIRMKKLPYLPSIPSTSSKAYDIYVEDFMVREVTFIWYGISYEEVKVILIKNKKLNDFPIVDSPESMILLGSAHRKNLISLIKEHVGEQKKLHLFNEWKIRAEKCLATELKLPYHESPMMKVKEAFEKRRKPSPLSSPTPPPPPSPATTEKESREDEKTQKRAPLRAGDSIGSINDDIIKESPIVSSERRPSRFSVTKVESPRPPAPNGGGISSERPAKDRVQITASSIEKGASEDATSVQDNAVERERAVEDGDKNDAENDDKRNDDKDATNNDKADEDDDDEGLRMKLDIQESDLPATPTSTITRGTLPRKSILKKTQSFVFAPNKDFGLSSRHFYNTIHGQESRTVKHSLAAFLKAKSLLRMDSKASHLTFTGVSRADLPTNLLIQKIKDFEFEWENKEMLKTVDFTRCRINPAPHQLVERSNLLQVHSIFSLLGLKHSYVTAIGRLIGVVSLHELRDVIERINSGDFLNRGIPKNRRYSFGFLSMR